MYDHEFNVGWSKHGSGEQMILWGVIRMTTLLPPIKGYVVSILNGHVSIFSCVILREIYNYLKQM